MIKCFYSFRHFNESNIFPNILTINSTDNIKYHPLQANYLLEFLFIQIRHNTSVTKILIFVSVCDRLNYVCNGYISCRILCVSHILHLQIHYKTADNREKCASKLNCSASNSQLTKQEGVLIIQLPLLIAILIELQETYGIT